MTGRTRAREEKEPLSRRIGSVHAPCIWTDNEAASVSADSLFTFWLQASTGLWEKRNFFPQRATGHCANSFFRWPAREIIKISMTGDPSDLRGAARNDQGTSG